MISLSFATDYKSGRTVMGNSAADCASSLTDIGADVIGVNCGDLDPHQTAAVIALLKAETSAPILAQPNAGKPKLIDDKTVFDMAPAPFAQGIAQCIKADATRVDSGATTPDHIRALSNS